MAGAPVAGIERGLLTLGGAPLRVLRICPGGGLDPALGAGYPWPPMRVPLIAVGVGLRSQARAATLRLGSSSRVSDSSGSLPGILDGLEGNGLEGR